MEGRNGKLNLKIYILFALSLCVDVVVAKWEEFENCDNHNYAKIQKYFQKVGF